MVKEGSARAKKFKAKHDPDLIMLRWKALRDWSIKRFYVAATKQFLLDDNIRTLIDRYVLPYGKTGEFMDLVRKFVYSWGYLTDLQKECLRQEWLSKGFSEELFDKIASKYFEMQHYITQHPTTDMVLLWFSELNPHPQEEITPESEDLTTKIETEYDTKPLLNMPYWKQEGYKEGILLRKLVTVFKGYDAVPLKINLDLVSYRSDVGLDFLLEISAITITEFEQYGVLIIPKPDFEIELSLAEIEKTLTLLNASFDYGANTSWLDMLSIRIQTANVFMGKTQTLTALTASLYSIVVLNRISVDLTQPSITEQSNVFEAKVLSNEIPNPSIEAFI